MSRPAYEPGDTERPRRYQRLATRAAIRALAERDSTTIAMPWGAGKTWARILAAERLAPAGAPIAHFVPNARHVHMTRREWRRRTHRTVIAACVPPAGEDAERVQHQGYGLIKGYAVANPAELARALGRAPGAVVTCPYDSLGLLEEAQRSHRVPRFAAALLDEVHRTASRAVVRGEDIDWTGVHDRGRLGATKRIGLSARPGACPPTGPVAYRLTYEAAVRAKVLPAYRVVVAVARSQSRADALLDPFVDDELVLDPSEANRNVLELIGHLRRRARGSTRDVLAALESTRPPREALADALRSEPWLRSPLEALANVDGRFAQALGRAREARPSRTGLLTVLAVKIVGNWDERNTATRGCVCTAHGARDALRQGGSSGCPG